MINFDQKTAPEIGMSIATRVRARRKELKLTQEKVSRKSGVPLSTYKRFEQSGLVSLDALVQIAIALGYEDDFDALFAKRGYASIEEVIHDRKR